MAGSLRLIWVTQCEALFQTTELVSLLGWVGLGWLWGQQKGVRILVLPYPSADTAKGHRTIQGRWCCFLPVTEKVSLEIPPPHQILKQAFSAPW